MSTPDISLTLCNWDLHVFLIIIIICPQAVGTEVQRDCNFKAHICRFSYLLGCISSLWLFFHLNYRLALVISIAWYTKILHYRKDYFRAWISSDGQKIIHVITGGPSSRLEKKPTINSWTRHALCDSVLSYVRNRWKFEHIIRNSMGNEILSIYNGKYFEIWIFYA